MATRAELLASGLRATEIRGRVRRGTLIPVYRGELDRYRYHGSRHAWEQDRRREREAYARGDEFRRYTYGDVFEHPGEMLTELRALLSDPA